MGPIVLAPELATALAFGAVAIGGALWRKLGQLEDRLLERDRYKARAREDARTIRRYRRLLEQRVRGTPSVLPPAPEDDEERSSSVYTAIRDEDSAALRDIFETYERDMATTPPGGYTPVPDSPPPRRR